MTEHSGFWSAISDFLTKAIPWIPGALGSALALKFLGPGIGWLQRLISFCAGLVCSIYAAPAMAEYFEITGAHTVDAIKFATGLFGLAAVREGFKEINELKLLQTIRDKFFGAKHDAS